MNKLTTLGKMTIVALIVGALFGIFTLLKKTGVLNKVAADKGNTTNIEGEKVDNKDAIKIGVNTWGGFAGGQYFNEGFSANANSRFLKQYGFPVEFKVLDDFDASRAALKSGEIDLLWATIDAFPTEVEALKEFQPQVAFQVDWSRGGDAIVVRRGITSANDLKGKTIGLAPLTPSHSFLIWMLEASNLTTNDVKIVEFPNAIDAASAFKAGKLDAAVVWSPDDESCVKTVAGAKVLQSTRNASRIIADVLFGKKEFLEKNKDKVAKLYEGWMIGASELNSSEENKLKAAKIIAKGYNLPEEDALLAINNTRLSTHGDNLQFFGFDKNYKGVTGEQLYTKMSGVYNKLGFASTNVPNWRIISNPSFVQEATLSGNEHLAEGTKEFTAPTETEKTAEATSSKAVTISFRSGEFLLDDNTKYIIDKEFVDLAKGFENARIRIEGNTDNVGNAAANKELSFKRAKSVADYLQKQYNMPVNRFVIIGNGPDKPVADNTTDAGKAKNRRTDFQFISE